MNAEQIAPIVLLLALAVVGVFYLHYRHRTRAQVQETIRSAISQGTQLTSELVQVLGEPATPKNSDLRRGIILLFFGLALSPADSLPALSVVTNEEPPSLW